jgi:hypothetical protein
MPKSLQGQFTFKKVTNGNKKHFAGTANNGVPGAIYLTDKDLKQLGIDPQKVDNAKLLVDIRVKP